VSCLTNPLVNDFSKRYHLQPRCKIRGSLAEAWRKVRGSKTVSANAQGSSRKRGGRFAEALGADVNRRANRVLRNRHVVTVLITYTSCTILHCTTLNYYLLYITLPEHTTLHDAMIYWHADVHILNHTI